MQRSDKTILRLHDYFWPRERCWVRVPIHARTLAQLKGIICTPIFSDEHACFGDVPWVFRYNPGTKVPVYPDYRYQDKDLDVWFHITAHKLVFDLNQIALLGRQLYIPRCFSVDHIDRNPINARIDNVRAICSWVNSHMADEIAGKLLTGEAADRTMAKFVNKARWDGQEPPPFWAAMIMGGIDPAEADRLALKHGVTDGRTRPSDDQTASGRVA